MQLMRLVKMSKHGFWLKRAITLFSWQNDIFEVTRSLRFSCLFFLCCLILSTSDLLAEVNENQPQSIEKELTAIITAQQHPFLIPANFIHRAEDLDALYKLTGYQLLWLGRPDSEDKVNQALTLLENAPAHGLRKENYQLQILQQKRQTALNLNEFSDKERANYDTALSLSVLRYLHDLHYGRVNPQNINFNLKLREKKLIDLPELIKTYSEQNTLQQLPDLIEPKLQQYQKLKSALATYRSLAQTPQPVILNFEKTIRPGENFSQLANLRRLLITTGYLTKEQNTLNNENSSRYTGDIVAAIKYFQYQHGLAADGVIGKATIMELNVPLQKRVEQIELAMERLRWLPELSDAPSILVNIPAFQLWAFENINDMNSGIINMRVVVGKAMKNQTPVLMATMSYIDFAPYWNVPYNIVKDEIIPQLVRNPGFLSKENMELVSSSGVVGFSGSTLAQLKQGTLRVRQRPGKKNALGRVKFLFPNKEDVYLHDTPANSLFSRSRRDFSHGCVRVANPEALAEFALKNQEGWDKARIQRAMRNPKMQRVILNKPIPVLFFYSTAFFDEKNNLVFYPDIYGNDPILLDALKNQEDLSDNLLFGIPKVPVTDTAAIMPQPSQVVDAVKTQETIKQ